MGAAHLHRATTDDGVEIAGRVHGRGSPLVLVHGGLGHGDVSFRFLVPLLAERFTCYCLSTRGRGRSGDHPDHAYERLVQDVVAFAASVGEPVGVLGHSSGGRLALDAAAETPAISRLAVYEPWLPELRDDDVAARNAHGAARISHLAAEGQLAEAAQVFFEDLALANQQEVAVLEQFAVADLMSPTVPVAVQELSAFLTLKATDQSLLDRITVPVLLLHGSRSHPFFTRVVHHLDEQLADARSREIAGAGHLGPQLTPDLVAKELTRWFAAADVPA
jgi:pimeloyl-ACP methyl ester carboxylesterase